MKVTRLLIAMLTAGGMVASLSSEAGAVAYGLSDVQVRNLTATFTTAAGGFVGFGTNFAFDANTNADITTIGSAVGGSDSVTGSTFSCDGPVPTGCPPGPVDPAQAFISSGGGAGPNPGENSFSGIAAGGVASYARADHLLSDVRINTAATAGADPVGGGGDWDAIAETKIIGPVTGTGASGNNQTWDFGTLASGISTVVVEFDLDVNLTNSTTVPVEDSSSEMSIVISMNGSIGGSSRSRTIGLNNSQVTPGSTILSEGDIDVGGVSGLVAGGAVGANCVGCTHYTLTFTTNPAAVYDFRIAAANRAQAQSIPNPLSLALLGAGLLGAGALRKVLGR